ncbi:hypothetical protein NXU96_22420 [Phocaeicola vulgatus]|nr:hypothetical protein [Phocaeicola vulgatus]
MLLNLILDRVVPGCCKHVLFHSVFFLGLVDGKLVNASTANPDLRMPLLLVVAAWDTMVEVFMRTSIYT